MIFHIWSKFVDATALSILVSAALRSYSISRISGSLHRVCKGSIGDAGGSLIGLCSLKKKGDFMGMNMDRGYLMITSGFDDLMI